jgi:Zn-dependent peptidase ImmA (M78 family)
MPRDYKVPFRREESLALWAKALSLLAPHHGKGKYAINSVGLINGPLTGFFADKGGLVIELFDAEKFDDPAYVTHKPRTLHVDRTIWANAKKGGSHENYILAHEIPHLLFHEHATMAPFSNDPAVRLKPFVKEESAEWQADTFAKHLMISDELLVKSLDPDVISILCNVEEGVVKDYMKSFAITGAMPVSTQEVSKILNLFQPKTEASHEPESGKHENKSLDHESCRTKWEIAETKPRNCRSNELQSRTMHEPCPSCGLEKLTEIGSKFYCTNENCRHVIEFPDGDQINR